MLTIFKRKVLVILILIVVLSCTVRQSDRNIEVRKLKWKDFVGKPDPNSKFDAYTIWKVYYRFDAPIFNLDEVKIKFNVWCELSEKSWVKKRVQVDKSELLNHEQGHFNIGKLCEITVSSALENYTYSKSNYEFEIDSIFDSILQEYLALEKKYDIETNHMYNRKAQKEWDIFFRKEFKKHKYNLSQ